MQLTGQLRLTAELTATDRKEMFVLMRQYYANVTRRQFEIDLSEKQWVIFVTEPTANRICGFSTQMLVQHEVDDRPLLALFSGDTIVDPQYWGQNPLAQIWGRFALSLIDAHPEAELYWFLISKGYKTYRFLPVFFHEFYPRFDRPTPRSTASVIRRLARHKYPARFDSQRGIVKACSSDNHLRLGVAEISAERLADPHVRFFVQRNPKHAEGDELCCLAPLSIANFTPAAYRVIGTPAAPLSLEHVADLSTIGEQ